MENIADTEEQIQSINKFNLKFYNLSIEEEYQKSNSLNNKKINIFFACFCIFLSISTLTFAVVRNNQIQKEMTENNLLIQRLDKDFAKVLKENEDFKKLLFLDYYLIANLSICNTTDYSSLKTMKMNSKDFSFLKNDKSNLKFSNLLNVYIFLGYVWMLEALLAFSAILILILSFYMNKLINKTIFYCSLTIICSFNFHTISGAVQFTCDSSDPIFIVIAFDLFFQFIFLLKSKYGWISILIANIIGLFLEWSCFMYLFIKYTDKYSILFYLCVNTLMHFFLITISYNIEYFSKNEFILIKNLKFEKDYLINFVDNMGQGFLSYNNKKILFVNRAMNKIIEELNENENNNMMNLHRMNTPNYIIENEVFKEKQPYENLIPNFMLKNNSNINKNSKFIIEQILNSNFLTQINTELPEDISKIIKKNITFKDFELYEFYRLIQNNKKLLDNKDFTLLGILEIKKLISFININNLEEVNNIEINNKENNNDNLKTTNCSNLKKRYQVMFRIISHGFDDDYLEIMFSDISKVLHDEREKTLLNSRSMYLSKIAHEFKNPLTSLMELSLSIKDELSNLNLNESSQNKSRNEILNLSKSHQKIYDHIDYADKIYKIMIHFLKDFTVFSNLSFSCDKNKNKCKNIIECSDCGFHLMCGKCNICKNCEEKKYSQFDYKIIIEEVVKTFTSLKNYENKNLNLDYLNSTTSENRKNGSGIIETNNNSKVNNHNYKINTNKELFSSVIFNLIYHSYKSSNTKTEIKIKSLELKNGESSNSNNNKYLFFEIINEGFEIDPRFIKSLNENEILNYEDDNTNFKSEYYNEFKVTSFNKYFDLYISYCILKKLNSHLQIETKKNLCKYSFTINYDMEEEFVINTNFINPNEAVSEVRKKVTSKLLPCISGKIKSKSSLETLNLTKVFPQNLILDYEKFKLGCFFEINNVNDNNSIQKDNSDDDINIKIVEENSSLYKSNHNSNYNFKSFRILVVDDEKLIRSILMRNLYKIEKSNEDFKFDVHQAADCFEAINLIYQNHLDNKQFDLVIIDECMPFMKGSTFIKLFKQLYEENNFYKFILVSHTSFDTVEKKKFLIENGADHILSKPVDYNDFVEFIIKLLVDVKKI